MYHFSREGQTRESWPSLETICTALDMAEKTVKRQRRALITNGWLKRTGEKQSKESGKFKIPVMMVKEGIIPEGNFYPAVEKTTPRVKVTLRTRGKSYPLDPGSKLPTEVHPEKQVNSNKQVDGFADASSKEKLKSLVDAEAGSLVKIPAPQGKNDPMVEEGPFDGVSTSQLVTEMLPHTEGMKLWRKYDEGKSYETHRAEIVAAVLEYQKTQEAQR